MPADHPHYSKDFVWQRQNRWSPEPNIRQADADYPVDTKQSHALMWNGVGGSTNVFGALWPRYRPSDFRKGTEHGLAPNWPLTYEELAPFYDASDRLVGVSGLAGDLAMPPRPAYPCAPLPMRASGRAIARGFDRLGWHWWPMPALSAARHHRRKAGRAKLRRRRQNIAISAFLSLHPRGRADHSSNRQYSDWFLKRPAGSTAAITFSLSAVKSVFPAKPCPALG